jgi:hypothetical protein
MASKPAVGLRLLTAPVFFQNMDAAAKTVLVMVQVRMFKTREGTITSLLFHITIVVFMYSIH